MHICKKKCFYNGKLWALGETLEPKAGEVLPKHFEKYSVNKKKEVATAEPKTFTEINAMEEVEVTNDKPIPLSQYGKRK